MTTHTPGPYTILKDNEIFGTLTITNGKSLQAERVAEVFGLSEEQVRANANLISCAPEMLSVLQNIMSDGNALPTHIQDDVEKIINKAKGDL